MSTDMPRHRVLLITTGSSPQVVTETVYALATASPPWIPERIVLATTADAARQFREGRHNGDGKAILAPLLGKDGKLAALAKALGIDLGMEQVDVLVPRDADGLEVADIRSDIQVAAFAEMLMQAVADITADRTTALHVSLAGGRKTMSFVAGQVMSLLGRSQDVLSHVLVEPASLESAQNGFWWPGDGSPGADYAKVRLHTVPFLRVRAWLDKAKLQTMASGGFVDAVEAANIALGSADVVIDLANERLVLPTMTLLLNARKLAILALVMLVKRRGHALAMERTGSVKKDGHRYLCLQGDKEEASRLWAWLYAAASFNSIHADHMAVGFHRFDGFIADQLHELDGGRFNDLIAQPISRLRRELADKLPTAFVGRILAPGRGYETLLEPDSIQIIVPADLADHPDLPVEVTPASRL